MSKLRYAFIILVAVVALLPLGDVLDDSSFNFSHIKNSFESIDSYDDAFVDDITKLGFYGEVISTVVSDGYRAELVYCSEDDWNNRSSEFVSSDGYVIFRMRYSDGLVFPNLDNAGGRGTFYYVDFPTPFNVNSDSYDDYSSYCRKMTAPIGPFINFYYSYIDSDNFLISLGSSIGMIASAVYAILFLFIVFLFDSISMIWGLVLCILRLIGLVPMRY